MKDMNNAMIARSSPAGLAWFYSDGAWILAPHLKLLSRRIVDVAVGRTPRLIVTMPPRHGKSELISRFSPAWFLGRFPDKKVMLASYSDQFAAQWGRAAREVLENVGPRIFGVEVDPETRGGLSWQMLPPKGKRILRVGVMNTAGVGGSMTGKGADLMIIDDPVKNAQDAQSKVIRDAQWDWWLSTARTRLQPGAGVILVMTRWHEDDLAGRFLASQEEEWEILNFPAICEVEGPDEIGRRRGEPLWGKMYPVDVLQQTERAMGNYWYGAMYQQRPAPAEGNLFKRKNLRVYEKDHASGVLTLHKDEGPHVFDPGYGVLFSTVDVAGTEKQDSDFTVVSTWCVTPERDLVWLDMEDARFDSLDVGGFVKRKFYEYRPSLVGIERLGFGLTVIQELLREGLPIVRLEPNTDKVARSLPAVARTEEHRVFIPKDAEWKERAISQLVGFPNATNDDIVDTVSYAALMLPDLSARQLHGNMVQKSPGTTIIGQAMNARL